MATDHRATKHLRDTAALYPQIWKRPEALIQLNNSEDQPLWPKWCFCPAAVWQQETQDCFKLEIAELNGVACLGAWRYTQGVYSINENLLKELIKTPISGLLPTEILMKMPEWCVYIETPGLTYNSHPLHGFFAFLDLGIDLNPDLKIFLDIDNADGAMDLVVMTYPLGEWTIEEAINRVLSRTSDPRLNNKGFVDTLMCDISPLFNLLLYVCSNGVEYSGSSRPGNPQPKKTKKHGWRLFPASNIRVWKLGNKTGEKLHPVHQESAGNRNGPRPHIRRAHWHTYRTGRGRSNTKLMWIPPTPVAIPGDE